MINIPKILITTLAISLVLVPNFAKASHDDAVPTGIRIQLTNVNSATGQVDFDVLLSSVGYTNTTTNGAITATEAKHLTAAWIGDRFFYNWDNPTTTTESNTEWVLVDPTGIKALDFGDGNVIDASLLALESNVPRTYRGSFSHTYTTSGNFTITTKVVGVYLGSTSSPNYAVNTGNPITFIPYSPTSPQGIQANPGVTSKPKSSDSGFLAYRPTDGSDRINARGGNMLGISNTAQVSVSLQSGFGDSVPIPLLDDFSKLLMGLFLALAGGFVLVSRK